MKTLEQLQESIGCKYFVAEYEDTQNWNEYIDWLNEIDDTGGCWSGRYRYYGYTGCERNNGTDASDNLAYFNNNPKLFTASEIMQHLRGEVHYRQVVDNISGAIRFDFTFGNGNSVKLDFKHEFDTKDMPHLKGLRDLIDRIIDNLES